jgi:acetyl esterase/lipase
MLLKPLQTWQLLTPSVVVSVCQLPSIRDRVKPAAAVAVYPAVDYAVHSDEKLKMRYYKPELKSGVRARPNDYLAGWSPTFRWSYIPVGHDLRDPLLSPYFAPRHDLPAHVFFIGAELDTLSHEAWRMANKLAGRVVPALTEVVGQEKPARDNGALILDDERFAFEKVNDDGKRSVRWLLVPDEVHGFGKRPLKERLQLLVKALTDSPCYRPSPTVLSWPRGSCACCTSENRCVSDDIGRMAL